MTVVGIGLGIVESLNQWLVWLELLADPVRYLQGDSTSLGRLGVRLKHEVKRLLPASCNKEMKRNELAPREDAGADDSVDIVLEVIEGGEVRGIGASGAKAFPNGGDKPIVPLPGNWSDGQVMPGVETLTTLPIGTSGK